MPTVEPVCRLCKIGLRWDPKPGVWRSTDGTATCDDGKMHSFTRLNETIKKEWEYRK